MDAQVPVTRQHGNAYNIFILVLTLYSLALMALSVLPLDEQTHELASVYDNLICIVFLVDFAYNLTGSRPRSAYFIHQRGWLDLIGSIPTFGLLRFTALLRLARLSRLARIARFLQGKNKKALVSDVVQNRGQYAFFITVLLAILVLVTASLLVLQFESRNPNANIQTGGDALWWAMVTITTVGYGDFYPITPLGRITAVFVMVAGIGIIGALASILASVLVTSPATDSPDDVAPAPSADAPTADLPAPGASAELAAELASIRAEIAKLRDDLSARSG